METEYKYIVIVDGSEHRAGYPQCKGCEHLTFSGPEGAFCGFEGDGCEYPTSHKWIDGVWTPTDRFLAS